MVMATKKKKKKPVGGKKAQVKAEEARSFKIIVGIAVACVAVIAVVLTVVLLTQSEEPQEEKRTSYTAEIDIKDYGTITLELDAEAAPKTVANFVKLADSGFYDGLTFHRIMSGFMMQGGDPNGDGTGGSSETIEGEFSQNGFNNPISHTRGTISMARSADPNSASSQFFIVHKDSKESLDGKYAAFGHVTKGIEIVDEICESAKPTDNNGTIPKDQQPVINSIRIK